MTSDKKTHTICCVLTRGIPVPDITTDTLTHICKEGETVQDVWSWAKELTKGSAWIIKLEMTKAV